MIIPFKRSYTEDFKGHIKGRLSLEELERLYKTLCRKSLRIYPDSNTGAFQHVVTKPLTLYTQHLTLSGSMCSPP